MSNELSSKTQKTIAKYTLAVCVRCDQVVNQFGESPTSAARSYRLGATLKWAQVAEAAAAGFEVRKAQRTA
jgi:predicted metal-binding protein